MKANKAIGKAVSQRMSGDRPSPLRAATSAIVAGSVVAASVYRALRSD